MQCLTFCYYLRVCAMRKSNEQIEHNKSSIFEDTQVLCDPKM